MVLNKLFNDNYNEIHNVAKRIVSRKCQYGSRYDARELMNETYLTLHGKEVPSDGFVKYFSRTMKLLFIGERSTYNKNVNTWVLTDKVENVIEDELIMRYDYNDVIKFKESLPGHLKTIFELHFEDGLSSRKIAKCMEKYSNYKMDRTNYNEMINQVKLKIKERWPNS